MLNIKFKTRLVLLSFFLCTGLAFALEPSIIYVTSPNTGDSVALLKVSETPQQAVYEVDLSAPGLKVIDRGLCQDFPSICVVSINNDFDNKQQDR
ncbi:MAG: hypothetical protein HRT35_11525 [Algicola sp.]|nr:hypothetical protein [Algicola sp.]